MPVGVSHVSLATGKRNYQEMCKFYRKILPPLGYKVFMEKEGVYLAMEPKGGPPDFWLHPGTTEIEKFNGDIAQREAKPHLAFYANSKKQVDDWYKAAIKAGGVCNGPPGVRPYMQDYYAAFVIDPVGNNIEAVYYGWILLRTVNAVQKWGPLLFAVGVGVAGSYFFGRRW